MPIYGDKVLLMNSEGGPPETAQTILWSNRGEVFGAKAKWTAGFLIVPDFVPDSQIPLSLSSEALTALVGRLAAEGEKLQTAHFAALIEATYLIKLLTLQQRESKGNCFAGLSYQTQR